MVFTNEEAKEYTYNSNYFDDQFEKDHMFDREEIDLRILERQYQGSIDQRNADVIEIEFKKQKRPVSIINKIEDEPTTEIGNGKQEEQKKGAFARFTGFIATKLCGTGQADQRVDKESEGLVLTKSNPQPVLAKQRRETDEDKKRLMEMKSEREQEIKSDQLKGSAQSK